MNLRIAYCGLYCGACKIFMATSENDLDDIATQTKIPVEYLACNGCRSDKINLCCMNCGIRRCCVSKKINSCNECEEFPCKIVTKKLQTTHQGEKKFAYRYEIEKNLRLLQELGMEKGLEKLNERWRCDCGGRIQFYAYTCAKCGKDFLEKMPEIKEGS